MDKLDSPVVLIRKDKAGKAKYIDALTGKDVKAENVDLSGKD